MKKIIMGICVALLGVSTHAQQSTKAQQAYMECLADSTPTSFPLNEAGVNGAVTAALWRCEQAYFTVVGEYAVKNPKGNIQAYADSWLGNVAADMRSMLKQMHNVRP